MINKRPYLVYLLLCLIPTLYFGVSLDALGQLSDFGLPKKQSQPTQMVTAHGVLSIDKVQPGSTFQIGIVMKFAEGWHANANPAGAEHLIPTEVTLPDIPEMTFGEIVYPKGELLKLASLGDDPLPVYHDEVVIGIQATSSEVTQHGQISLPIQLRYQACSDAQCLFPTTITVDIPIEIVGNDQTIRPINDEIFASLQFDDSSDSTPATGTGGKFAKALSEGKLWLAFLMAFGVGILTSLTPCVYPLIPITVSVFGANESTTRLKSFLLSVTYVAGIALMFSILGVVAAKTGAVFGQVMTNPFVIGPICAILIALGFSMLGVFELRLPYAMQNRLNNVGGAGFIGAFAMGTVAGIIAAPCTGPALAFMLAYVATTGNAFLGFWLMLIYALGMGLLFILIGTFSGTILPRSGTWMYVLENIFGILIITVALYFLKDVIEPLRAFLRNSAGFFAIAGVLFVLGMLLSKLTQRFKGLPRPVQFRKAFGVLLAVLGLYMAVGGLTTVTTGESHLDWVYDEAEGLEIAQEEGKPIMLDFYAIWCAACIELDKFTYSDSEVASRLSNFVNIKLDFSRSSKEVKRLTEKYEIPGLPVVIFLDSKGKPLKRLEGFVEPEKFLEILDTISKG